MAVEAGCSSAWSPHYELRLPDVGTVGSGVGTRRAEPVTVGGSNRHTKRPLWEKLWEIVFRSDSRKQVLNRRFGPKVMGLSRETPAALCSTEYEGPFF